MDNELKVPNHIAIILDGNGRWAKKRNMPRGYGHIVGCDNLEKMCDVIKDMGVKYLTVYAFSTENWKRSRAEVEGLLKLFRQYLKRCIKKAHKNQMRVKIIGDPSAFPQDIQDSIHELEECSKDYDHMYSAAIRWSAMSASAATPTRWRRSPRYSRYSSFWLPRWSP